MKTKLTGAHTRLERHVQAWINHQAADYEDGATGVLLDLQSGGCASGYVTHLIYYAETAKFFQTHRREISQMLTEEINDCGLTIEQMFGEKWDNADPLAQEQFNRNLLAWYGFEETARRLAARNNIEL